jgi:hypothetical protein
MPERITACALLLVVWGCSGDGDDPPWDPGDPLPASCAGESALEARIGDGVYAYDGTTSGASRANVTISSPVAIDQPWHILQIQDGDLEPGRIALPDERVRLSYSMNPNGSDELAGVNLDTEQPTASNWYLAEVDGELAFGEAGVGVGERRCGWIDVTLRWAPVGEAERSLRARGTFDATVEEIVTDR